jgi:uncharacterized protein (DUF58 family)
MPKAEEYLRPDVIAKVARLDLKAKFIVEGYLSGLHASPFQGFSVEFSEHRKYSQGDDLRSIDWNVYAKTDRYYVKKFEAETNMECTLVVDSSASMGYAYGAGVTKLEYSIYIAAALGYMMVHQQDSVGLAVCGTSVEVFMPAKSKRAHLVNLLARLANVRPGGKTGLAAAIHQIAEMVTKRGLVVIFSDLLTDEEELLQSIHHLKFRGHDVIVFHVLDAAEAHFPFEGVAKFRDVEGPTEIEVDPQSVRAAYLEELERFRAAIKERLSRVHIDYVPLDTSMPFDKALTSFLANRSQYAL